MADYGAIIGGVVGAVIGSFVPGLGTATGWAIGSALGGAYSASQQVISGPKIGEVTRQTSQEGGFRPIVYGRSQPIAGNIIADGGPVIVTRTESQGKGGPKVESESAFRTYAVGFCEGEATLLQAWRNGILVYDAEDPSFGPENAKFLEYATWYTGSFDQNASPDLESIYGVGQAPYFRGTAYLSIHEEDVTDQRGAWSQWQVRVFRGGVKRVTTPPYPIEVIETYIPTAALVRGQMVTMPIEEYSVSIDIVGGQLRQPVIDYSAAPEAYVPAIGFVSGVLDSIIVNYPAPPEAYNPSIALQSGVLDTVVVTYVAAPEAYNPSIALQSGTLT